MCVEEPSVLMGDMSRWSALCCSSLDFYVSTDKLLFAGVCEVLKPFCKMSKMPFSLSSFYIYIILPFPPLSYNLYWFQLVVTFFVHRH